MVSIAIADPLTDIVFSSLHYSAIDGTSQKIIVWLSQVFETIASTTTNSITNRNFEALAGSLPLVTNPIDIVHTP